MARLGGGTPWRWWCWNGIFCCVVPGEREGELQVREARREEGRLGSLIVPSAGVSVLAIAASRIRDGAPRDVSRERRQAARERQRGDRPRQVLGGDLQTGKRFKVTTGVAFLLRQAPAWKPCRLPPIGSESAPESRDAQPGSRAGCIGCILVLLRFSRPSRLALSLGSKPPGFLIQNSFIPARRSSELRILNNNSSHQYGIRSKLRLIHANNSYQTPFYRPASRLVLLCDMPNSAWPLGAPTTPRGIANEPQEPDNSALGSGRPAEMTYLRPAEVTRCPHWMFPGYTRGTACLMVAPVSFSFPELRWSCLSVCLVLCCIVFKVGIQEELSCAAILLSMCVSGQSKEMKVHYFIQAMQSQAEVQSPVSPFGGLASRPHRAFNPSTSSPNPRHKSHPKSLTPGTRGLPHHQIGQAIQHPPRCDRHRFPTIPRVRLSNALTSDVNVLQMQMQTRTQTSFDFVMAGL